MWAQRILRSVCATMYLRSVSMYNQGSKTSTGGQRRLRSDCADAQSDLSIRWLHGRTYIFSRWGWFVQQKYKLVCAVRQSDKGHRCLTAAYYNASPYYVSWSCKPWYACTGRAGCSEPSLSTFTLTDHFLRAGVSHCYARTQVLRLCERAGCVPILYMYHVALKLCEYSKGRENELFKY